MYWSPEATALLNQYLDEVQRNCELRGVAPAPVVAQVGQRVAAQVDGCGVTEVSADLVRGILAATGPASSIIGTNVPPPLPRERVYLNPVEHPAPRPGVERQVWRGSPNTSQGCIIAACVLGGLLCLGAVIGAVMLPALARAREAARRATCQNNMKQIGIELRSYAGAHTGSFPPLVAEEGYMIFRGDINSSMDLALFQCPSEGTDFSERNEDGSVYLDSDYLYLGYAIRNQAELEALQKAFHEHGEDIEAVMALGKIAGPDGDIVPLREDLEGAASIPVLVEWTLNHDDRGANVLYLDGHTEFIKVGSKFPVTAEFYDVIEDMLE